VVFEADYNEMELQNIVMTSFQWRHHHYVTEKRHKNNVTIFFPIWALPIKISGYASDSYVYRFAKFDAIFFNFFARLFILFYYRSEKFRISVNGKIK